MKATSIPDVILVIFRLPILLAGVLLAITILIDNARGQEFETALLRVKACDGPQDFCESFRLQFEDWKKVLISSPSPEHRWKNASVKTTLRKEKNVTILEIFAEKPNSQSSTRVPLGKKISGADAAQVAFGLFHGWFTTGNFWQSLPQEPKPRASAR